MAYFKVVPKPSVAKDLRSLPKQMIARVIKRMGDLEREPFPRQAVKLEGGDALYRIRVGEYRIVYAVNRDVKEVTVHYIRHRREVYRKL